MKRIAIAVAVLLSAGSLIADDFLTGVHSVYIAGTNFSIRRDIARALKSELPQVRVVPRASDAGVILELRGASARYDRSSQPSTVVIQKPTITSSNSNGQITQNVQMVRVVNPEAARPTHVIGSFMGIAHRSDRSAEVVLHEGLPSPFFATQFAARFVRAWRDANP